jgi:hypothetical protein
MNLSVNLYEEVARLVIILRETSVNDAAHAI